MRCSDCNKFVSYGDPEIESNISLNGDRIEGSIRVALTCAECGGELKENEFEVDIDLDNQPHECEGYHPPLKEWEDRFELDDDPETETIDYFQSTDRRGKPIKSARYQKHMIGVKATFSITCNRCKKSFTVEESYEEQASAYTEI